YSGELPTPITREEKYLYRLATDGVSGSIDEKDLEAAVAAYIESAGITGSNGITFSINADDLGLDVTIHTEDAEEE
ncbi:MAG: hypothetical protein LUG58_00430, partial [Clostridiales bacterium]|nr:hypothetical protein [Clostridiales bacterium]